MQSPIDASHRGDSLNPPSIALASYNIQRLNLLFLPASMSAPLIGVMPDATATSSTDY
jgi:hypothetical protein